MLSKDVMMEDICCFTSDFLDMLSQRIDDYPEMSNEEDILFEDIRNALEKFFNYPDYRRYN